MAHLAKYLVYIHIFMHHISLTDQFDGSKDGEDTDFNHFSKLQLKSEQETPIWWQWSDSPLTSPPSEELSYSLESTTYPKISTKHFDEGKVYISIQMNKF